MGNYVLSRCDGSVVEIAANNDQEAIDSALARLSEEYPDVFACDTWDQDGVSDDDEPMERLLVWATEEESINDDGGKSVAEISAVRS